MDQNGILADQVIGVGLSFVLVLYGQNKEEKIQKFIDKILARQRLQFTE